MRLLNGMRPSRFELNHPPRVDVSGVDFGFHFPELDRNPARVCLEPDAIHQVAFEYGREGRHVRRLFPENMRGAGHALQRVRRQRRMDNAVHTGQVFCQSGLSAVEKRHDDIGVQQDALQARI